MAVQRTASGSWRALVRYPGLKRQAGPSRKYKKDAEADYRRIRDEMEEEALRGPVEALTVEDLIDRRKAVKAYSPATLKNYAHLATRDDVKAILNHDANALTGPKLGQMLEEIPNMEYRRQLLTFISAGYKLGIEEGKVIHNPAKGRNWPGVTIKKSRPPSDEELKVIIAKATEYDPRFGVFVRLVAHTGLRRSEAVALEWSAYDGKALTITQNYVEGKFRDTKTGRSGHRVISLNQDVRDLLDTLPRDAKYLFHFNGEPWKAAYASNTFGKLKTGFTLHSLRHWMCSTMLRNGFSVAQVAARAGDSVATISRVYVWAMPAVDQAAADSLPF